MKLEIVVIPVSDVDRAKEFYARLGWRLDADFDSGNDFRVIQFTPPGSGCSVIFGKNVTAAAPGSAQGLYLIVSDIEAARDELLGRGVKISEVFHDAAGVYAGTDEPYLFGRLRVSGRIPSIAATARSPRSAIRTATAGCSRRSRRGFPGASTPPRLRSPPQATWRARFGVRRPPTASTRSAPASATRTGPTGTPRTWRRAVRQRAAAMNASPVQREPELLGQTVVVIGGSAGIGLETARRARAEGANVILTGRNPERLQRAASELDALSTAAFDATDFCRLERFFGDLPKPIDHVMVTAGRPYYGRLVDMDFDAGAPRPRRAPLAGAPGRPQRRRQGETGRHAAVHGRHRRPPPGIGLGIVSTLTAALPALTSQPRARARARPSQPHRRRLRRHTVVGIAPRR